MFNYIIYFVVVLLIFSVGSAEVPPPFSFPTFLASLLTLWVTFGVFCHIRFQALLKAIKKTPGTEGYLTRRYYATTTKFAIAAIVLFAIDVFLLDTKYWLRSIPLFDKSLLLQGLVALGLFIFFLCTIWTLGYPCYKKLFESPISRKEYVLGQIRLNVPVLLPWAVLSLVYDIIELSGWGRLKGALDQASGQIIFFALFLPILMIFMPRWVQFLWGCKPLKESEKVAELRKFLAQHRFRYRDMLIWPVFEGRVLTAGIMGLFGRYRYILVTDALLDLLNVEELKAVLAHEMGHARYKHLAFYLIFFVGFIAISMGLFDIFFYMIVSQPFFIEILTRPAERATNLFYLTLSLPMILTLVIYFRYVMGFFMRNFERQVDLYSARLMGTPIHTITSLEKIALWSGKSRDIPSWHHFSIKQRVEYLKRMAVDPKVASRHNRFVLIAFVVYLVGMSLLTYELNFTGTTEKLSLEFLTNALERNVVRGSSNIASLETLAMLYEKRGEVGKAANIYRRILSIEPDNAVALNNLAWILATDTKATAQEKLQALELAKRAVAQERNSTYLDTLAEAYFINGEKSMAIETEREALALARENKEYYRTQLKKFGACGDL